MRRLLIAIFVIATAAGGQAAAQKGVAAATGLRCSFTSQIQGHWRADGSVDTRAGVATLTLRFEDIDTDSGTAQLRTGQVTSELIVRASEGYLNLLQVFRTGPMYTTTVFDAGANGGKFKAVHSRHEYFTAPVPGATSTPEQYYGECEAAP